MCYNVAYIKRKVEKLANHKGIPKDQIPIFPESFWANGFSGVDLPVITNALPNTIQLLPWGLIPSWTKNTHDAALYQRKHLNARDDTLYSSGVWQEPVRTKRCLVILHGFYEYHHIDKKTKIPYLVTLQNDQPMILAGLWDQWKDKQNGIERTTITIVTTSGNSKMKEIHNNPDVLKRGGARMPLILGSNEMDKWLNLQLESNADKEELTSFMVPYPEDDMEFTTVNQLAGKYGVGNTPKALEKLEWPIIGLP